MSFEEYIEALEVFSKKGEFIFRRTDSLSQACNAPNHSSGIYLIYAEKSDVSNLIYIGIAGREKNGEIIHRKDGLGGRITKGKQFDEPRKKSWPKKMKEDRIQKIIVEWYITYGAKEQVFPRRVEKKMLRQFYIENNHLPIWNKEI
jgi:hypothetical protein